MASSPSGRLSPEATRVSTTSRKRLSAEEDIGRMLKQQGRTMAVAESCTGGLLGYRLTSVPGSSGWFCGGVIAYANAVKRGLLGVPAGLLRTQGAVSSETAAAMADGARRRCGADVGVGITGIAGPGGGTKGKPVGLVYAGVSDGRRSMVRRFDFGGNDRTAVRAAGARAALKLLREFLRQPGGRYDEERRN